MPDIFVSKPKDARKSDSGENIKLPSEKGNQPEKIAKHIIEGDREIKKNFKKSPGIMSTFILDPQDVTFADQEPDEKILLFVRRHLITNLDWVLLTIVLIAIPIILAILNMSFDGNLFNFINFPPLYTFFSLVFYYSMVFTFILVNFISWFFNVGLITTRRIVDIDLNELIYKDISTTKYTEVQDASYIQQGAVMTIFNFGDVVIQTAGPHGNFRLEAVPRPERVVHLVEDFIGKKRNDARDI